LFSSVSLRVREECQRLNAPRQHQSGVVGNKWALEFVNMIDIGQNNECFKASPNERASLRGKTTLSEQHGLSPASNKFVSSADLLKKVYFPRLAIPTVAVFLEIVAFALALLVLLG
jgi:hypothetical protein